MMVRLFSASNVLRRPSISRMILQPYADFQSDGDEHAAAGFQSLQALLPHIVLKKRGKDLATRKA